MTDFTLLCCALNAILTVWTVRWTAKLQRKMTGIQRRKL